MHVLGEHEWEDWYLTGYLGEAGPVWHWCAHCGDRWYPNRAGRRFCDHPKHYTPFPDQDAVRAAYALGGRNAVHVIEQALWKEHI